MSFRTTKKTYLAIFLIGAVVIIAGISVYGIYQRDTSQTPTTIYKDLTEAEEEIVKENIKTNIQQQKRKETKEVEKKQPSYVENMSGYDNNQKYQPEPTPEAPVSIVTKADAPGTETPMKQFLNDAIQADIDEVNKMLSQFPPADGDWGNIKSKEIISKDDLKKIMADLKASGNLTDKSIIQIKKSFNAGDGKWIEVEIDDK